MGPMEKMITKIEMHLLARRACIGCGPGARLKQNYPAEP